MLPKSLLKLLTPRAVKESFERIHVRLMNLEIAVKALLESPRYTAGDAFGFNGQVQRKRAFEELLSRTRFEAIVETGTYTGDTTGYLAGTSGVPVRSCELNETFHSIARMRLAQFDNVHLECADSRDFLVRLSRDTHLTARPTFFYLDAHWYDDLPLREEVELIARLWSEFAIMIDDFEVPGDPGYAFDDYGRDRKLSLDYLSELLTSRSLVPFFPSAAAGDETGERRGWVLIVPEGDTSRILDSMPRFRRGKLPRAGLRERRF